MDQTEANSAPKAPQRGVGVVRRRRGLLKGMGVRKKVFVLHTLFSLGLAAILLVPLRPLITEVVEQAEINEAGGLLRLAMADATGKGQSDRFDALAPEAQVKRGGPETLGISAAAAAQAGAGPGRPVSAFLNGREAAAVAYVPEGSGGGGGGGMFWAAVVTIPEARRAV